MNWRPAAVCSVALLSVTNRQYYARDGQLRTLQTSRLPRLTVFYVLLSPKMLHGLELNAVV